MITLSQLKLTREHHPYGLFLPSKAKHLLIGSFPIAKFTNEKLRDTIKQHEIDFSYGGERSRLWPLLSLSFGITLNTRSRIEAFLKVKGIGIGDVVLSCKRKNGSSSDDALREIEYNYALRDKIERYAIDHILFTSNKVQQWFEGRIGCAEHVKRTLLISPSGSGVRGFSKQHQAMYERWAKPRQNSTRSQFRTYYYMKIFNDKNFPDIHS